MANSTCKVDRIVRSVIVIAVTLSSTGFDFQSYNHASYLDAHSETSAAVRMPAAQEATTVAPKTSQPAVTLPRYFLPIAPLTYASEQTIAAEATIADRTRVASALRSAPVMFIENVGQVDPNARFQVRGAGGTIYLASDAVWVTLLEPPPPPELANQREDRRPFDRVQLETPRKGVNLRFTFEGANPNPRIEGFDRFDTAVSYFIGDDPNQWRTNVPAWGGVRYVDLYPSIDLEITSLDGEWAWRLVARDTTRLSPEGQGVGDGDVRLRVAGAADLALVGDHLRLTTTMGQFRMPLIQAESVPSVPVDLKNDVGLISPADHRRPAGPAVRYLTDTGNSIPSIQNRQSGNGNPSDLLYSTFLGGSGQDIGWSIAADASGATYVAGNTASSDFPTKPGSFSTIHGGANDAFVTKLSANGSLAYSTFLGGNGNDYSYGVAVDATGAAYVTGRTPSSNFPITPGAFQTTCGGCPTYDDAFITKLNAAGSELVYSTYLGGNQSDLSQAIAVDASGAVYVTGETYATDFPTLGAFQTTCNSCSTNYPDAFVTKLNAAGSGLVYSTFLGGSQSEGGLDIAVDASGAAYIVGLTFSANFPTLQAFQATCGGCPSQPDAFVTKLNAGGSLAYSTFLGGNKYDQGRGIAVDASGAAYVTGWSSGSNNLFPTTPGAFQTTCGDSGCNDAFVSKLNAAGNGLVYSTRLGGNGNDVSDAIAVDANGAAYVTGDTQSSNFPTTPGAFDTTYNDGGDVFATKLKAAGNGLVYSTYIGGSGSDYGYDIALDASDTVYLSGQTFSTDFPTTPWAFDTSHNGSFDTFVIKRNAVLPDDAILTLSQIKGNLAGDGRNCGLFCWINGVLYFIGDPINTRTGAVDYTTVDLSFPALGGQLVFQRSYSSLVTGTYTTSLGFGWTHNQDTRLILPTDPGGVAGQILFKPHGASRLIFYDNGDGTYTPQPGVLTQLVSTTVPSGYRITSANQSVYTFNSSGRLLTWADAQGHTWTYTYDASGRLTRVEDGTGLRFLTFAYDTNGRLISVSDPLSRTAQYGYDVNSDLTVMTDTRGLAWTYAYSSTTHLLAQITDPDGRIVERTEYDAQGRAMRQFDALGVKTLEIAYNADGARIITDALGHVTTATYDQRGALVSLQDATGQSTQKDFDGNFRPARTTDENGNTTNLTWSETGANLTQVVDAQGNATKHSCEPTEPT